MSDMWLAGDEDGGVSIVCNRPLCMKHGPITEHNPRGLYWSPTPVLPYRPSPLDVLEAWSEHLRSRNP